MSRTVICIFLHDKFLKIFLLFFAVYNGDKLTHFTVSKTDNKIPVGATWLHRPHNFLAVGAIAPVVLCSRRLGPETS